MTVQEALGISAGILSFASCPIYVRSIIKGRTKPDRITWWVLALASVMIAATYQAAGARQTIWLPIAYAASFLIIGLFSLKYGDGPLHLHRLDRICLAGALASAIIWPAVGALAALIVNMVTELLGLIPTAKKAFERPWTEDRAAWAITSIASVCNVLAIDKWTFAVAAYPVYVLLSNAVITALLLRPHAAT